MNYEKIMSRTVQEIKPSGIRRFFDLAADMKDVISLGVGEPDFKTPWTIRRAGIESLEKGHTWYTANAGLISLARRLPLIWTGGSSSNMIPRKKFLLLWAARKPLTAPSVH